MKTYNLTEAAQLLCIDLSTLRRWRKSAGGVGARGPADRRRAWLTRAELLVLARAHGRVLVDSAPGADIAALTRAVVDLRERVEELENKK